MSVSTGPLAGVKVLELGTLIAGPFAARFMGEFGADVIKIEDPNGGDPLRKWRKLYPEVGGTSLWWAVQARNKKSVTVNLKSPDGKEIVRRLAKEADIVVENFRPGLLEKLGLGYEVLSAENPGLVMVRLSGYGQTGRALALSLNRWADCATSPVIRTCRRRALAFPLATPLQRCMA